MQLLNRLTDDEKEKLGQMIDRTSIFDVLSQTAADCRVKSRPDEPGRALDMFAADEVERMMVEIIDRYFALTNYVFSDQE